MVVNVISVMLIIQMQIRLGTLNKKLNSPLQRYIQKIKMDKIVN
jgi:hypothetical protein